MSVIRETVCGINTQLDRLQQQIASPHGLDVAGLSTESLESIGQLQDLINSISVTSKTQSLLSPGRLADLLSDTFSRLQVQTTTSEGNNTQLSDHVWIVAAKAAIQASGLVMNTLLDQTLQLHDETYYWGEMLGSIWYSGLYAVQKSPAEFCLWTKDACVAQTYQGAPSITARWTRFYRIACQSAWKLGGHSIRAKLLSPIRSSRAEMRQKRDLLLGSKDLHTSSLGLLMEGWHLFEANDPASLGPRTIDVKWRDLVHRSVVLIEAIFQQIALEPSTHELEQGIFATLEGDIDSIEMHTQGQNPVQRPLDLIERLVHVLREKLPDHTTSMSLFIRRHGRPSRIFRYWLPVSAALLTGSVSMRFLTNRREEIIQSIVNIGSTTIDFWGNWVVHPIRKLIGTIRHDEKSEIAIMSKDSLLADRASLERMVVDFVRDRPDPQQGMVADTTTIVNSVKEGDLTPVLKAYERDLRSPFIGTVRGDLIRALLIQIQKTKVDVEIAISGIDALLKSQELVFGFVGLTPGILVSFATMRWLGSLLGSRRGLRKGKQRDELKRGLRNVARILTSSAVLSNGTIAYKDSGQLICEAEALLQHMKIISGSMQYEEFREDIQDLLNVQNGVDKQIRVIERMRWAYFQ
ncbi:Nuclear control of ATP synthase 2 [Penicillium cf. griseofulvum]|uniref:Nuclear control of ATP synthase 2 n=1 Tax=Penicillium cf. griseofulvum TaxID=2972120 RepID=A0A9W9MTM3_9EURO|nr:Nuclear control of ATP synthase 2 [Penicillium cf. griseofulvum]KAJ5446114.1 Nuclear control of ATP synthase 2 [Penicillium cf. griseofulvum]KAJ5447855.1 Nuclear control of ATP synthase 2 [Penicillium cf. griseofulvum]